MTNAASRLLLVVPCYNEAQRLDGQPFLRLVAARRELKVLFVDDGSTDRTGMILADIASGGGERIAVLTLPRNHGKAEAVRHGVLAALNEGPEMIGYWDADLSTPLSALREFVDVLDLHQEIDIVMGARVQLLGRHIERKMLRHYTGRLFATAASIALRLPVYDTQCGAKVFRVTEATRQAFSAPFPSPWVMDVELLARYMAGVGRGTAESRIYEVPLHEWRDVAGSKLRLRHAWRAFLRLWTIGRRIRRLPTGAP
jgi:glycosyltransferase involved in cell wall biosynthesis